jgi:hypothetical protein
MRLKPLATGMLVVAITALVAPLSAAGKEGVRATLRTAVPLDAEPGARLKVAWTLTFAGEDGVQHPFGAGGVFVRLVSASGGGSRIGFAGEYQPPYTAVVTVPEGGIGDIQIGVRGQANGKPSDLLFPIGNKLSNAGSAAPGRGQAAWIVTFAVAAGALLALAILTGVVRARRPRRARRASPSERV